MAHAQRNQQSHRFRSSRAIDRHCFALSWQSEHRSAFLVQIQSLGKPASVCVVAVIVVDPALTRKRRERQHQPAARLGERKQGRADRLAYLGNQEQPRGGPCQMSGEHRIFSELPSSATLKMNWWPSASLSMSRSLSIDSDDREGAIVETESIQSACGCAVASSGVCGSECAPRHWYRKIAGMLWHSRCD